MSDSKLEIRNIGIEKIILSCAYSYGDTISVFPTNKVDSDATVCFHFRHKKGFDTVYASAADTRALGQALIELADQIETNKDKDQT